MSPKILSSALLVSLIAAPFIYALATLLGAGAVLMLVIANVLIVYIASAASAWLSVRVAQSDNRNKRKPARTARTRDKVETPAVPTGPREAGQVKWFNASKGFGFITRDSGEDIFVHFRSIRGDGHRVLKDGQRVEFSVSMGDKGLQADDVAGLAR